MIQQEKAETNSVLAAIHLNALIGFLVPLFLTVIHSTFYSRPMVSVIRFIRDAANKVSKGNINAEIISISSDEIGELADALTRMQEIMKLTICRLQKSRT